MKKLFLIIILFLYNNLMYSQDELVGNHSKFMQKYNPSYFGFNGVSKLGFLYNSTSLGEFEQINSQYIYGTFAFSNAEGFSLGAELNRFTIQTTGYNNTIVRASPVYRLQIGNQLFLLPSVSLSFGSIGINPNNLVFEDQLEASTGFINSETIDPLGFQLGSISYFEIGASFLLHNRDYIVGLSFKNLNSPDTSLNDDIISKRPISVSLQGGYEFNLNPYNYNFLPEYSYMFTYLSFTKFGSATYIFLSEEFQMGALSLGLSQQLGSVLGFGLNNVGISAGATIDNFDFGFIYNIPFRSPGSVYSPSVFELYLTFDFSRFRRNRDGFKKLQIDNY